MTTPNELGRVVVFGGSGFLGRAIVQCLTTKGVRVRVAVRHPDKALAADISQKADSVEAVYADVRDETSIALAMSDCQAAVNAVGLYVESGAETFEAVHELGALNVAHQAAEHALERLVHLSGIGADLYSKSSYVRSRAKGELLVSDVFPRATILRPSAIFAPDDKFLNTLADIGRVAPVIPLFGSGATQLQPVYVVDVAEAVAKALTRDEAPGRTYELGGAHSYTYRALLELVLASAGRRRVLLPVPFAVWDLLALMASILPRPPITAAQVILMKHDNVVSPDAHTLQDLGIDPTALEDVLPQYLFAGGSSAKPA